MAHRGQRARQQAQRQCARNTVQGEANLQLAFPGHLLSSPNQPLPGGRKGEKGESLRAQQHYREANPAAGATLCDAMTMCV